jgi:cyanophycinase
MIAPHHRTGRRREAAPATRPLLLVLLLLLAACGAPRDPALAPAPAARGHLLIVGGGPRPAPIMERFVELAGGPGRARIVVLPMASGTPDGTGEEQARELRALGADAFHLALTREQAARPETLRRLEGVTGVWFSGGDQNRITAAILGTPADSAIHARYRAGAVVGGTSAGAAVMSRLMITGEERRPGGPRPVEGGGSAFVTVERENVETAAGLGLLPGAIVDQHFLRRRRQNRLVSLVLEHPTLVGVGIDESTALVVGPDGRWEVIGEGLVAVYDARGARVAPAAGALPGASDLRLHILPPGSVFDPRTGRVRLPGS